MANIAQLTRQGRLIGFQSDLGLGPDGKKRRKFHKTYAEAEAYVKAQTSHNIGTGELYQKRAEIIFCLQRVTLVGASLTEAVEFFLKHGAKKGNPLIAEVVKEFIRDKRQVKRKEKYLESLEDKWTRFIAYIGEVARVGDVTSDAIKEYVYEERK